MASFTDQIPQFNPFVPTLPVDAMVQVGMYKQQKYEENVQKIQAQIDNIAGLDVLRNVDKQYLQSKLNELGNNLTSVAAGDFSNFQLVNSVSGMTNQIVKDPYVQAAVSSAANHKKNKDFMEEERKKGTLTPDNEHDYNTQLSSYLNSGLKDNDGRPVTFGGQYVPHVDVFKKLGEIAKSVGEDSTIVQQLFITDANGNPVLKNGQLQYNDVMAETLLKGKDKNKILSAFQNGLDANDYRQLSITGRYEMRDKTPDDISKMLEDGFMDYQKTQLLRKDAIQDKILELKTKGGFQDQIDALQEASANIDLSIAKRKASIEESVRSGNVEGIKGSIYTNNYLDSMSAAFSTKDTYTKYLKNPAVEVMMDREKMKLDVSKFKLEQDKFRYQQLHDKEQMAQERWKALFEKGLVDEKGNPTGAGLFSGKYRERPLGDITDPLYFSNAFEQGLKDDMDAQFGLYEKVAVADWVSKYGNQINPATNKPYTAEEMKSQISAHAKKVGMSYNDYVVLQGQKATDRYNATKGQSLGAEYAADFAAINELGTRIGLNKKRMDNEAAYIAKNAQGFTPFDFKKVNVQPMDLEMNVPTRYEGGKEAGYVKQKLHLTKEDLYNFALISSEVSGTAIEQPFTSSATKQESAKAFTNLVKKFGSEAAVSAISRNVNGYNTHKGGLRGFMGTIDYSSPKNPFMKLVSDDNFKKTMTLREQYYKENSDVAGPGAIVLYADKAEQREHLQSSLASVASDYQGIDSGYEDLTKAALDDKAKFQINIDPAASRYGNNSYSLQVTKSDGTIITKPITEKHFTDITGKTPPSLFIDDITLAINNSPFGTTNLANPYTDPDAYSTAFVKDDQTRTKNYNVAMDFALGSGGLLFPKLYVQQENGDFKLIPYNAGLTPQQAKSFPSMVDDVFVKSLLYSKK